MKRTVVTFSLVALLALTGASASASLIGDEIDGFLEFPGLDPGTNQWNGTTDFETVEIDGGVEFSLDVPGGNISANFGDSEVWIQLWVANPPIPLEDDLVFTFEDINWVNSPASTIQDVYIASSTLDGVNVVFGPNSFSLIIPSQMLTINDEIIHLVIENQHPAVPEPATLTLLGLGLAGVALRRRQRSV